MRKFVGAKNGVGVSVNVVSIGGEVRPAGRTVLVEEMALFDVVPILEGDEEAGQGRRVRIALHRPDEDFHHPRRRDVVGVHGDEVGRPRLAQRPIAGGAQPDVHLAEKAELRPAPLLFVPDLARSLTGRSVVDDQHFQFGARLCGQRGQRFRQIAAEVVVRHGHGGDGG